MSREAVASSFLNWGWSGPLDGDLLLTPGPSSSHFTTTPSLLGSSCAPRSGLNGAVDSATSGGSSVGSRIQNDVNISSSGSAVAGPGNVILHSQAVCERMRSLSGTGKTSLIPPRTMLSSFLVRAHGLHGVVRESTWEGDLVVTTNKHPASGEHTGDKPNVLTVTPEAAMQVPTIMRRSGSQYTQSANRNAPLHTAFVGIGPPLMSPLYCATNTSRIVAGAVDRFDHWLEGILKPIRQMAPPLILRVLQHLFCKANGPFVQCALNKYGDKVEYCDESCGVLDMYWMRRRFEANCELRTTNEMSYSATRGHKTTNNPPYLVENREVCCQRFNAGLGDFNPMDMLTGQSKTCWNLNDWRVTLSGFVGGPSSSGLSANVEANLAAFSAGLNMFNTASAAPNSPGGTSNFMSDSEELIRNPRIQHVLAAAADSGTVSSPSFGGHLAVTSSVRRRRALTSFIPSATTPPRRSLRFTTSGRQDHSHGLSDPRSWTTGTLSDDRAASSSSSSSSGTFHSSSAHSSSFHGKLIRPWEAFGAEGFGAAIVGAGWRVPPSALGRSSRTLTTFAGGPQAAASEAVAATTKDAPSVQKGMANAFRCLLISPLAGLATLVLKLVHMALKIVFRMIKELLLGLFQALLGMLDSSAYFADVFPPYQYPDQRVRWRGPLTSAQDIIAFGSSAAQHTLQGRQILLDVITRELPKIERRTNDILAQVNYLAESPESVCVHSSIWRKQELGLLGGTPKPSKPKPIEEPPPAAEDGEDCEKAEEECEKEGGEDCEKTEEECEKKEDCEKSEEECEKKGGEDCEKTEEDCEKKEGEGAEKEGDGKEGGGEDGKKEEETNGGGDGNAAAEPPVKVQAMGVSMVAASFLSLPERLQTGPQPAEAVPSSFGCDARSLPLCDLWPENEEKQPKEDPFSTEADSQSIEPSSRSPPATKSIHLRSRSNVGGGDLSGQHCHRSRVCRQKGKYILRKYAMD